MWKSNFKLLLIDRFILREGLDNHHCSKTKIKKKSNKLTVGSFGIIMGCCHSNSSDTLMVTLLNTTWLFLVFFFCYLFYFNNSCTDDVEALT